MNIDRREMLSLCAVLPFVGFSSDNQKKVQFSQYIGPGKRNRIDQVWADWIIEKSKAPKDICWESDSTEKYDGDTSTFAKSIYRELVKGCYLSKEHSEWFTSPRQPWRENYLWYGDVNLVKDTIHLMNGSVKTFYYICRGDAAIILRPKPD